MQAAAYERVYFTTIVLFSALIVISSAGNCDCTLLRTNKFDNLNEDKLAWCAVYVPEARRQIRISPTRHGQSFLLPALPLSHSRRRTQGTICMRHDTRQIAISSGKGSPEGSNLGVMIMDELRKVGWQGVGIEPRLRQAAAASHTCFVDEIYGSERLDFVRAEPLGWHAASGLRIANGCPMHILYGASGGCSACRCRVPTAEEMKRLCPYYGSSHPQLPGDAEQQAELLRLLSSSAVLVIISAREDVTAGPDRPAHQAILAQQASIVDVAVKAQVSRVVLVGPSDPPADSLRHRADQLRRDAQMFSGLSRAVEQFSDNKADRLRPGPDTSGWPGNGGGGFPAELKPLLLETYLHARGLDYVAVRVPSAHLDSAAAAQAVVESVRHPTGERLVVSAPAHLPRPANEPHESVHDSDSVCRWALRKKARE